LPVVSPQPPTPNPQPPVAYTPPHLAERIRAEQVALEARGAADGERKTITALFADLKGSTALIERLDPEEARALIDPALQLMMDAVHRYEGYVAQALGDGIFALFGAPLAHEDHPQRALYAALRMQEEMRRYADTLRQKGSPPLQMRIGLNTGEVVVRSIRKDDLHADYVPVGHSTNLAARMEQLANPGTIVVSAYTHRLTDGYFAFKDLGPTQIKGVEEPLNIYEVLGAGPLRTRLQVSAHRGLTRFVGRQSEMDQLQRALTQAKAGHGQIVGVMGEPGLGKSRLFYEFKLLSLSGCLVLEAYSVSHGKATAYLPVIELLKSYFDIQAQDDERTRREKVGGKVLMLDRSLEDTLPYLFALLGIEEQPSPLQQMDPQIRRKRTFEALKRLFLRESLNQPLMLIFEDLHWIDSETQGFLDVLSESVASARILLLVNHRPEYRHEWGQKTYYTQLRLTPFGREEAEEFLDALLGELQSPLPVGERDRVRGMEENLHALKHLILEKTEGTPFFMEEIVQELKEQGVLPVGAHGRAPLPTDLHLPPTVQGVLAARIDRLDPGEKALLQQLAVIGREFPLGLVKQVVAQPEEELYWLLSSLQRKEFLYEQPAFPEPEYVFKHALTQEVAYNSVLTERRKTLHEQTAQAIEQLFHDRLEEHYSELAHHYSRSSNTEKAIEYLHLAGQQAAQRSAFADAVQHLTFALGLLETMSDSQHRRQQELAIRIALGTPLVLTKGHMAPEVETTYTRALTLCQQLGDTPELFPVLLGLRRFYGTRGELLKAYKLGEQLLSVAQSLKDSNFLLRAHVMQAELFLRSGEFSQSRAYSEQGLTLYDPHQHRAHTVLFGNDSGVGNRVQMAWVLYLLGYADQSVPKLDEALALAREIGHPFDTTRALFYAAVIAQLRRESRLVGERAEVVIALAAEHGFELFSAWGSLLHGWVLAENGQVDKSLPQIQQGLVTLETIGSKVFQTYWLALFAEACGKGGQAEAGLKIVIESLAMGKNSGERWYEAELYRLKGELTLQSSVQRLASSVKKGGKSKVKSRKLQVPSTQHLTPNTQEAEACFLKAIDIARKQQAKSWELRAAVSLARLWHQQGRKDEARQLLSEIYGWFTEGFDTKDLQEAKALLAELG
jgi:class 3 adenylate cyclase/predicted ATPase